MSATPRAAVIVTFGAPLPPYIRLYRRGVGPIERLQFVNGCIAIFTVASLKNHVSTLLAKFGVRDRTRAVLRALELDLA